MKRIFAILISALTAFASAYAQSQSEKFEQRYDLLVRQLGPDGVGVENVLNNWEAADPSNPKMLMGKFTYYFNKARQEKVVTRPEKKYLGMDPLLALKDSTGADVYYYQVPFFDDELYGKALQAADDAIAKWPDRLDFRFLKANACMAYEQESPDMTLAYLLDLVKTDQVRDKAWEYDGKVQDESFFSEAMQEYCYSFYALGSPSALEAFLTLSETMAACHPDKLDYLNNIGSYHLLAANDYKTAIKFYNKVLKKDASNYTAIKNAALAARKMGNVKLEKKYLQMLMMHGPEEEKMQVQARLNVLK